MEQTTPDGVEQQRSELERKEEMKERKGKEGRKKDGVFSSFC